MCRFVQENKDILEAYARLSAAIGARADYVQGGGGNTSAKLDGSRMAIKASGVCLRDVKVDAGYAVLDFAKVADFYRETAPGSLCDIEKRGSEQAKAATLQIEGLPVVRPSVEAGFHSLLDTFVIHSHSVYANLACCAQEGKEILAKALVDTDIVWGFIPYIDPGARLTFAIRDEIARVKAQTGAFASVLFLQNHGVIVHGNDANACIALHERVNAILAAAFGLCFADYPTDGAFQADALASGRFSDEMLLGQPLFPDQMVYFIGTLGETMRIDYKTGAVTGGSAATRETLTAVVFVVTHIEKAGYTLSTMGEAAQGFIANWESEKYRKSLSEKK